MKLLVDMNLSPRWVEMLQAAQVKGVHWSSVGRADAPDTEIMAYAREHDFVVLTHDLDFSAILAATGGDKPSVVQLRAEDVSPETIGPQVIAAIAQLGSELELAALVTIDANRTRIRMLPLRVLG